MISVHFEYTCALFCHSELYATHWCLLCIYSTNKATLYSIWIYFITKCPLHLWIKDFRLFFPIPSLLKDSWFYMIGHEWQDFSTLNKKLWYLQEVPWEYLIFQHILRYSFVDYIGISWKPINGTFMALHKLQDKIFAFKCFTVDQAEDDIFCSAAGWDECQGRILLCKRCLTDNRCWIIEGGVNWRCQCDF